MDETPQLTGLHSQRLAHVRALLNAKGRREQGRFFFEGATLLGEARRSGLTVEELYVTREAYEATALVRELEAAGVSTFEIEERAEAKISDLETPSGIVAVAPIRLLEPAALFEPGGLVLVLAGLNDPGNAGTLLRSADAFGCRAAVFGADGVDPYHPKVVRSSMGALFRLQIAVAAPEAFGAAARFAGTAVVGLAAAGEPIGALEWPPRAALIVGHERHGLGAWEAACDRLAAIPMPGPAESLNAAIAGSIALYEAAKRPMK